MRILFYNPAPSQRRCSPFEALRGSPMFRRPNYDAMRLAWLSQHHDFTYFDEQVDPPSDLIPDLVVINVPLNLARYVETMIPAKWDQETPTICFGEYPTLFPEETKQFCRACVVGDVASVWHRILGDLRHRKLGAVYTSDRITHFRTDRSLEMRFGFNPFFSQIRTSYGCSCAADQRDYCPESVLYKRPARWKIDQAARGIAETKRKAIFALDDDFLSDPDYAMRLLDRCWRYKKNWIFQTTGKIFNEPRLLPRLRDHGVRVILLKEDWLGHDLVQDLERRPYVKEKSYQIAMVHSSRITVGCKIRLGYDGEDEGFYERLLRFLVRLRVDIIEVAVQTPLPGTMTYEKYRAQGRILPDLAQYDLWLPVVETPGLTSQERYRTMERLRDRFYSWDSIMSRNLIVSPKLGFYNTVFFYILPNLSYRSNFLEKVGYPP